MTEAATAELSNLLDHRELSVSTQVIRRRKEHPDGLQSNALQLEDDFNSLYYTSENHEGTVIAPPHDPRALRRMVQRNNTLLQAVTAMEVNIDGTGHTIEMVDNVGAVVEGADTADPIAQSLSNFFTEPYPQVSWTTIRRKLRRDLEETGNGYLEVLRNPKDEIVFVQRVDATTMRILRLDEAVDTKVNVLRNGEEAEITLFRRERRFLQIVGQHRVYFKEFGGSRDLRKDRGVWTPQGQRLPFKERASEIIHMTVVQDSDTPYGVPRWINQTPSVLGSRAAEELNLEYFESGGIPPVVVFVEGGTMGVTARQQLDQIFNQGAKDNVRAAIVDIMSSSGSMDGGGSAVKVNVEKFGSGNSSDNDGQFQNYDERTALRVRAAFRLPGIFLGLTEDYSHATAYASYTVAEAQVFAPEREEFDEEINLTLVRQLTGSKNYRMRSLPLQVTDSKMQLQATQIATQNGAISGEDLISALNEIANTELKYTETEVVELSLQPNDTTEIGITGDIERPEGASTPTEVMRTDARPKRVLINKAAYSAEEMVGLACKYLAAGRSTEKGDATEAVVFAQVDKMSPSQYDAFSALLRNITMPDVGEDDPAFAALAVEAAGCVGHEH